MAPLTRSLTKILLLRDPAQARINRLPIEIFTAILRLCLPDKLEPHFVSKTILFCHVCSFWRTCLLDLSSIWGTLSFNFDSLERGSKYSARPTVKFWLAHAKQHPLSLSVSSRYHDSIDEYNNGRRNVNDVFNDIAPFADRIQELDVAVDSIFRIPFFIQKGIGVPALERLSLQIKDRIDEDMWDEEYKLELLPITVFDGAPALRVATLGFSSERLGDSSYFPFPWYQLTHLNIVYRILPSTFDKILKQCINLEEALFTIGSLQDMPESLPRHPVVTLDRLSALKIKLAEYFTDESLRDYAFPSLRQFDLLVNCPHEPVHLAEIPAGISPGSLKSLQISGMRLNMDISTISQYLSACSSLEKFILYLPEIPPRDIYSALAKMAQFLPKLETLILYISLQWEKDLVADETVSVLETLFAAWSRHVDTGKTMRLLTLYPRPPQGFGHYGHWGARVQHERHDKVAEIQKKLCCRLKIGLCDGDACPTGFDLDVKYLGIHTCVPEGDEQEEW
ncbi:hypothetical protein C0995_012332 [Termitomyces sp. Mi166|nr:hypothetical protein C0995_012332 [Termitomyces sp. Mi166\